MTPRHPTTSRPCVTCDPVLAGHRVHISITLDGGRPVAIACDVARQGSPLRGPHHAIATFATMALTKPDADIGEIVGILRSIEALPCGDVTEHDTIKSATSIADLMGQVLSDVAGLL